MAQNIWEYIRGDDVTEAMRICGCDEKYISGKASDFEKFRELLATLSLFENNGFAEKCCEKIGVAIGEELTLTRIKEYSASLIWKKYGCLNSLSVEDFSVNISDEKNNYMPSYKIESITADFFNRAVDILSFANLLQGGAEENKVAEKLKKPIAVRFLDGEFDRPNRYSAENVLKKINRGEKCNNAENNTILCHLVCEIIYAKKDNQQIFAFDIKNGDECAEGLIKYLVKRGLGARIYLLTDSGVPPLTVKKICLCGNRECFVTPLLSKNNSEYLQSLEKIYPRGLIIS